MDQNRDQRSNHSSKPRHKNRGMRESGFLSVIVPKNSDDNIETMVVNEKSEQPVVSSRINLEQQMPFLTEWSAPDSDSEEFLKTHFIHRMANKELPPLSYCIVCQTDDHVTVNCMVAPPDKIKRICALGLCCKCLESGHKTEECPNQIRCEECRAEHLDYIFHKPQGWIYDRRTTEVKAIAAPPVPNGANLQVNNLRIDYGPQQILQPKKEEVALLPNRIVDPSDSTTEPTSDTKQRLINFYKGENFLDLKK